MLWSRPSKTEYPHRFVLPVSITRRVVYGAPPEQAPHRGKHFTNRRETGITPAAEAALYAAPAAFGLAIPWNSSGKCASTSAAPPSTSINWPVIQLASSEQIIATALPMSDGVPNRPMGVHPRSCHSRNPVWKASGKLFNTLSSTQPGLIVFTVIPRLASATAKYRTSTSVAAFAAPIATQGYQLPKRTRVAERVSLGSSGPSNFAADERGRLLP